MSDINDLIKSSIEKSPVDFSSALDDILNQKAQEAIEVRRIEIAQGLYGEPEEVNAEANDDEDLDIDIGDLDTDIDLEDIEDNEQD